MAEMTIRMGDSTYTFDSKKEMLKTVGYEILSRAENPMTLRQLYYRFVGYDLIDNNRNQYSYLGKAMTEARVEGEIPWEWIEDRNRGTAAGDYEFESPKDRFERLYEDLVESPERYNRPRWERQPFYVEVWVEKAALAGIFADVCRDLKVISFPNRGYSSITLLKQAADRMQEAIHMNKECEILYFGDYDPSGQDIERNIREKLNDTFDVSVDVNRIALTEDQIDEHELPPQPAKSSDPRYEDFVEEHGNRAVELDALDPSVLRHLIRRSVEALFDEYIHNEHVVPEEEKDRDRLQKMVDETLKEQWDTEATSDDVISSALDR